jgi:deoxyribonucleoside regulator
MNAREELQLILRASRFYYEDGLTQKEVADELGLSRPMVSRLLSEARAKGVVRISIIDPFARSTELEAQLVETFHLSRAVVTAGDGLAGYALVRRIGLAAAEYLRGAVQEGQLVGVGWGRTVEATIDLLSDTRQPALDAVPLIGGLGQRASSFQVNDLARRLAEAFGGTWQALYAPAFVADPQARNMLLNHPDVRTLLTSWDELDTALVGIGFFAFRRQASMFFSEYLEDALLKELEERETVGDLCGRFFDVHGQQCALQQEIIGVRLEQLKATSHTIGVAGGPEKVGAILGALRGGYVHVLVTDSLTAQAVLDLHTQGV